MKRFIVEFVFVSAGLISADVGAAAIHAAEMEDLKLAVPLPLAIVATTGLPIISTAAFEPKFCVEPIGSHPAIVSAYFPEPSFVERTDSGRREQASIENCESLLPARAASISLVQNMPLTLDARATSALHEGGVAFEASRVMPLGVFSSR
jgi:hypothetical protein